MFRKSAYETQSKILLLSLKFHALLLLLLDLLQPLDEIVLTFKHCNADSSTLLQFNSLQLTRRRVKEQMLEHNETTGRTVEI